MYICTCTYVRRTVNIQCQHLAMKGREIVGRLKDGN